MSDVLAGQVLHLQWNAYTSSWGPVLRDLRAAGLFHDLTLVTGDNQLVTAHKIVLAACSQFFRGLLASLPMQTTGPLAPAVLYMRGVTGAALLKLLDFMYNGEVNVEQQLLKEFLQLGEDLRVQGLCEELVDKGEEKGGGNKHKERKEGGGSTGKEVRRSFSGKEKIVLGDRIDKKKQKENAGECSEVSNDRTSGGRKDYTERKAGKREVEEEVSGTGRKDYAERKTIKRDVDEEIPISIRKDYVERKTTKREIDDAMGSVSSKKEYERKTSKREVDDDIVVSVGKKEYVDRKTPKREVEEECSMKSEVVDVSDSPGEELETGVEKDERMLTEKERRTPTPRKKIRKLKSLEELKDDAINRDVLTMDPGEAHGILKLIENLDHIEENSEDLNIFVQLLNQLILKSNIANNVLYFCGICQKSLKSKQHMVNHVEANHVEGVFHICSDCGAKMKTRSSLFSHKNKNHKVQKKEAPEGKTAHSKVELLTVDAESTPTKPESHLAHEYSVEVQNRQEYVNRIEDVQNSYKNVNMSERADTHHLEDTANHYSSDTEFE